MKKLLLTLATCSLLATPTFAKDLEVVGRITQVNHTMKTFTVMTPDQDMHQFAATPATEFEYKKKVFSGASFKDLKDGVWVKVEYKAGRSIHTADEVKIYPEN